MRRRARHDVQLPARRQRAERAHDVPHERRRVPALREAEPPQREHGRAAVVQVRGRGEHALGGQEVRPVRREHVQDARGGDAGDVVHDGPDAALVLGCAPDVPPDLVAEGHDGGVPAGAAVDLALAGEALEEGARDAVLRHPVEVPPHARGVAGGEEGGC